MYTHCCECPEFFEGEETPYYWTPIKGGSCKCIGDCGCAVTRFRCENCTKINQVTKLVYSLERDLISSKRILDGLIDDRDRKKAKK